MLYDDKQLPELRYLKQFHDDDRIYFDYEKDILNKSLSPYMYENQTMARFLDKLSKLLALSFDQINIVKNFKNYMVDKYHYKQKG
jgi:hypothetical protein